MLPAAGQGILVLQGRAGEDYSFLEGYTDRAAELSAVAERAFVRWLDGGCSSPIAAHAVLLPVSDKTATPATVEVADSAMGSALSRNTTDNRSVLRLAGLYYDDATGRWHRDNRETALPTGAMSAAETLGITLAQRMKAVYGQSGQRR
jgi:hydroxymethylbilane synthase